MWYNIPEIVLRSALKHGVNPDDALYVIERPIMSLAIEEEPLKILHLGISPEGIPLEVVTVRTSQGDAVIHAMRMRTKYVKLLEGGGR